MRMATLAFRTLPQKGLAIARRKPHQTRQAQQWGFPRNRISAVLPATKNYFKIAIDNFDPVVHIHIKMSKELDMATVENCVCFNLRWVARAVTQFYDSEMRRHGIRPTQGTILLALNSKENWSMAELSDWLGRSEEHTSELQSHSELVCRLLLEKKK